MAQIKFLNSITRNKFQLSIKNKLLYSKANFFTFLSGSSKVDKNSCRIFSKSYPAYRRKLKTNSQNRSIIEKKKRNKNNF